MLYKNPASHLLEQSQYKYSLQDVEKPNLYRDIYSYDEIPKIAFNHRHVPLNTPENIIASPADDYVRHFVLDNLQTKIDSLSRFVRS